MVTTREDYRLTGIVLAVVLLIVGLVLSAVDANSSIFRGLPAVAWCAIIVFGVQWLAWIPASIGQTERFYDLTGGMTYLVVVAFSLWVGSESEEIGSRELMISALVAIWSVRLSGFLFLRIHHKGKDGRFDDLKTSPVRFLVPWTLQGLWIFLTANVVIVVNSQSGPSPPLGIWDAMGLAIWILGFWIEVLADSQKTRFNSNPDNKGKWIDRGPLVPLQAPELSGGDSALDRNRCIRSGLLGGSRVGRLHITGLRLPATDQGQRYPHTGQEGTVQVGR